LPASARRLIAIMSDVYTEIQSNIKINSRRMKANTIIEVDEELSETEMGNKDWFPEYLEVLEVVSDAQSPFHSDGQAANERMDEIMSQLTQLASGQHAITDTIAQEEQKLISGQQSLVNAIDQEERALLSRQSSTRRRTNRSL
jgi:small-conductance mechanosensitive channel